MEKPESFEDAVMVCSHDSVWEAWLLTQSNLRNGGEHTHLVAIQRLVLPCRDRHATGYSSVHVLVDISS
jgi:hypothetical protein